MPADDFEHVRAWVFDLDNTLYPPAVRLFDQIEVRMTAYVMETLKVSHAEADRLRKHYWHTHGTTLAGLMREHGIDPLPFLKDVHDISFDELSPDVDLAARIDTLPGRKIVYTNGCAPYAERVLAARGLSGKFDAIYGVEPCPIFTPSRTVPHLIGSLAVTAWSLNLARCSRTIHETWPCRTPWVCARFTWLLHAPTGTTFITTPMT